MEFLTKLFFATGLIFFMIRLLKFVDIKNISKDNLKFWNYVTEHKNSDLSDWDTNMKRKMYTEMGIAIWILCGVLTSQWIMFSLYFLITILLTSIRSAFAKYNFISYICTLKLLCFQTLMIAFMVINEFHLHIPLDLKTIIEHLK